MGLQNAPSIWHNLMDLMDSMLADYVTPDTSKPGAEPSFLRVYLDDLIVFSSSWEDHYRHVKLVIQSLQNNSILCGLPMSVPTESTRFQLEAAAVHPFVTNEMRLKLTTIHQARCAHVGDIDKALASDTERELPPPPPPPPQARQVR